MADHTPLPEDATLRSLGATLDDKRDFVSRAYKVINDYQKQHGPVVLRVGTSRYSKGKRPNYRIDDGVTGELIAVIDGNNHQPWTGDEINLSGAWSKAAMNHAEVRQLSKELWEKARVR